MGVRGGEEGDGSEWGAGDGEGEEALDEGLGGRCGSVEEVGFEVGANRGFSREIPQRR